MEYIGIKLSSMETKMLFPKHNDKKKSTSSIMIIKKILSFYKSKKKGATNKTKNRKNKGPTSSI